MGELDDVINKVEKTSSAFKDYVKRIWNAIDEFVIAVLLVLVAYVLFFNSDTESRFNVLIGIFTVATSSTALISFLLRFIVKYDVWKEIKNGNQAAAIFAGLYAVAFAISVYAGCTIFLKGTVG